MTIRLDWSGQGGAPRAGLDRSQQRCKHCGRGAYLRHPVTKEPCHKVCEEIMATVAAVVLAVVAATFPYRPTGGSSA